MECKHLKGCIILALSFCFLSESFYAFTSVSDEMFGPQNVQGRLLQIRKPCPVNFEIMNYTIITSQCKEPEYNAKLCCMAFLEFSCPHYEQINDLTNDCATTMFSYIAHLGKYPPGLFASLCKGDTVGLACPQPPATPSHPKDDRSSHIIMCIPSSILMLAITSLVFLVHVF